MVIGVGIDLIEISRVKRASGNSRFLSRVFTLKEQQYFEERNFNPQTIAGGFAVKEAVAKALGTGLGKIGWTEIEVLRDDLGRPYALLHGNAYHEMKRLGGCRVWISISHSQEYAVAQAVIEG